MLFVGHKTIGKGVCRCLSAEHADNELELGIDDLPDGLLKKPGKEQNQLEVAIGDGMEFTIHGDSKKAKKQKSMLNNINVSMVRDGRGSLIIIWNSSTSQDDDTASIKSYGSHKNRPFKDESHKGSAETMEGEEKRDVSKEDLGIEEGK